MGTNSEKPVVVIDRLTKRYGSFTALENLSLTLSAGQILGLIGPNGAGKTTTIKILVGLSRPTSGTARIGDADCVADARRIKKLVGYMPDRFGSYDNMRVREYLDFFGAAFEIPRARRIKRIEEVMETTNTAYMRDKFVESLSHGMQQRVGHCPHHAARSQGADPRRAGQRARPPGANRNARSSDPAGADGQNAAGDQSHSAGTLADLRSGGDRHQRQAAGLRNRGGDRPAGEPAANVGGAIELARTDSPRPRPPSAAVSNRTPRSSSRRPSRSSGSGRRSTKTASANCWPA
jgi:predicted ABC-type transport system involved in lysophospholipase L1 biosynthesis ATPase subunit